MRTFIRVMAIAGAAVALGAAPANAGSCFKKSAEGTGVTEKIAKFQVDAALLQATDWSIYFTYVASGTTPGYSFGPRTYKCSSGGVGTVCRGSATLCEK